MKTTIKKSQLPQFKYYSTKEIEQYDLFMESTMSLLSNLYILLDLADSLNMVWTGVVTTDIAGKPFLKVRDACKCVLQKDDMGYSGIDYLFALIGMLFEDADLKDKFDKELSTSFNKFNDSYKEIVEAGARVENVMKKGGGVINTKGTKVDKEYIISMIKIAEYAFNILIASPQIIGGTYTSLIIGDKISDKPVNDVSPVSASLKHTSFVVYPKLVFINNNVLNSIEKDQLNEFNLDMVKEIIPDEVGYLINIFVNDKPSNKFIILRRGKFTYEARYFNPKIGATQIQILEHSVALSNMCNSTSTCPFGRPCELRFDELDKSCRIVSVIVKTIMAMYKAKTRTSKQNTNKQSNPNKKTATTRIKQIAGELYVPTDISISNISYHDGEVHINSTRKSSPRKPHVRCGHYRHYKNGKVVYVESSIIHKDKYTGYTTATYIR